jgi:hypothetical protein
MEPAPAAPDHAPTATGQTPSAPDQSLAATDHAPTASDQPPAAIDQAPAVSDQSPATTGKDPLAPDQSATGNPQDPDSSADDPVKGFENVSTQTWALIDWVIATADNNNMPFMVIDKVAAKVFLFDASGQKIAAAPALIGMSVGDEETPFSGDRELSNIPPEDRKTPAGRFVAKFGRAAGGRDVLWVDYPSAISLHAVIQVKDQHRLERLKSPSPDDKRITYGCINVPTEFYAKVVKPMFKQGAGIVYILPDTKSLNEIFLAMPPQPGIAPATPANAGSEPGGKR